MKIFSSTLIILFSAILFSCSEKNNNQKNIVNNDSTEQIILTKTQIETASIELGSLINMCFHERIITNGKVITRPNGKIIFSYPFTVTVKNIFVNDGDRVYKNQPLFSIEGLEILKIQQDYSTAFYKLQTLKTEYERLKNLINDKIVSEREFKQLENEYYAQQTQLNAMEAMLETMEIKPKTILQGNIYREITVYSPVDGFIKINNLSKGMVVEPNTIILEIYDPSQIVIGISMFEKDVINVHQGDTVFFYRLNEKNKIYKGILTQIGKVVDNQTHTLTCYAKPISYEKTELLINSFVQVEILYHDRKVKALPEEALIKQGNDYYVYVLKKQLNDSTFVFEKKFVDIGVTDSHYVEILDTISTKIIVKGANIF